LGVGGGGGFPSGENEKLSTKLEKIERVLGRDDSVVLSREKRKGGGGTKKVL